MIEVNFKDRVPTNPGRVTLNPVAGQANTYDMARADSPTEEGTPLDKATFDSITKSRLTGRFYPLSATSTVISDIDGVGVNPIPTSWLGSGLSYKSGLYEITASIGSVPYAVEDGDIDSAWIAGDNITSAWWQIKFPADILLRKFKIRTALAVGTACTMTIQGSSDGTSWTDIGTWSTSYPTETELTTPGAVWYRYYRINFATSSANGFRLYSFAPSDFRMKTVSYAYTGEGMPTEWTDGQRVMIYTPNYSTAGVVANTLNGVTVNTILQGGKRYELIYTGTAFVAKEV